MKPMFARLFALAVLHLVASPLYAGNTGYEVELVIFEDTTARYLRSEDWSYNDKLNHKKAEKVNDVEVDPEYTQLEWSDAKLANKIKRLENNSNYRILLKKRWKQTGLDRKHAFTIPVDNIIAHKPDDTQANEDAEALADSAAVVEDIADIAEQVTEQKTNPFITGNIKLIMSRYLHFNVDIRYIRPEQNDISEYVNRSFPVVSERRMRSKEIHYIDHPLVGVIVLATPYKIETEDENTAPKEYKTM